MNIYKKVIGFVGAGLIIGLTAKLTPHTPISITPPEIRIPESSPPSALINAADLLQQYKARPLFISKSAIAAEPMDTPQTNIAETWSPLDYQLIGISGASGQKTGWFKHVDTDELISARLGMRLGSWTLEGLSSTEARLSSGNETESLKLFQGSEPR